MHFETSTTNLDKTEIIWSDRKPILPNLNQMNYAPSRICWYQAVHCGTRSWRLSGQRTLHMRDHISRTGSSCFFHLRRLRKLRGVVCCSTMQRLVSALVLSRLDYCNTVLSGLPSTTLDQLRWVLNAEIRLVAGLGPRDRVTEQMKKLHWLPIKYRTNFKLCLMIHTAVTG